GLVESLADRIVDRAADIAIAVDVLDGNQLCVPAGYEEQQIGKADAVRHAYRQGMRLEMIDRDQRLVCDKGNRLGGGEADNDAADQAGAGGGGNRVELGEADARLIHGAAYDGVQKLY